MFSAGLPNEKPPAAGAAGVFEVLFCPVPFPKEKPPVVDAVDALLLASPAGLPNEKPLDDGLSAGLPNEKPPVAGAAGAAAAPEALLSLVGLPNEKPPAGLSVGLPNEKPPVAGAPDPEVPVDPPPSVNPPVPLDCWPPVVWPNENPPAGLSAGLPNENPDPDEVDEFCVAPALGALPVPLPKRLVGGLAAGVVEPPKEKPPGLPPKENPPEAG